MINLESTRTGWVMTAFGATGLVAAVVLTVWDVAAGNWWIAPLNLVTFSSGIWCCVLGAQNRRGAREHHRFMEQYRRRVRAYLS